MKVQALILLFIFLTASLNQAYCCTSYVDFNAPSDKGEIELCEKHSCCSSSADSDDDQKSDANHETCKCLHLSVMDSASKLCFQESISNNFYHALPKADQWLSRLIYKEIFQPPKFC